MAPPNLLDEDSEEEEMELSPELDGFTEDGVFEHPYTSKRYTWKTLTNDPKLKNVWKTYEDCWEPGHSCRKHWEDAMRTSSHHFELIPQEKRPLKVFPREMWGAVPASGEAEVPVRPCLKVVLNYNTGLDACETEEDCKRAVKELQRIHMEEWGLRDIAYNFIVGGDMNIYLGRGWSQQPDEVLKYPQWRHRRFDIAFLAPREGVDLKEGILEAAYEYLNIGVEHKLLRIDHDLYEHADPPDTLFPVKKLSNTL